MRTVFARLRGVGLAVFAMLLSALAAAQSATTVLHNGKIVTARRRRLRSPRRSRCATGRSSRSGARPR